MRNTAYILALLGGILLSFQGAIYGQLGERVGQLETSFFNFFVGSILLGLMWLFFGKGKLPEVLRVPKWTLFGGALGVVYLTLLVVGVPFVGVGAAMVALIFGQLVMSMTIEHFGWLGMKQSAINKDKIFAVISMLLALILIQ